MLARHILLPGVSVRYPNLWSMIAQHAFGQGFGAAGGDLVQYGPVRDEHPLLNRKRHSFVGGRMPAQ